MRNILLGKLSRLRLQVFRQIASIQFEKHFHFPLLLQKIIQVIFQKFPEVDYKYGRRPSQLMFPMLETLRRKQQLSNFSVIAASNYANSFYISTN